MFSKAPEPDVNLSLSSSVPHPAVSHDVERLCRVRLGFRMRPLFFSQIGRGETRISVSIENVKSDARHVNPNVDRVALRSSQETARSASLPGL